MLDFDQKLQKSLGEDLKTSMQEWIEETQPDFQGLDYASFKLIDYCRYVDDMRLVVIGPRSRAGLSFQDLKEILHSYIDKLFEKLGLENSLNDKKTKITVYRGKQTGISKQLNDIQSKASAPQSFDESFEQLNQLEMLLALSSTDLPEQDNGECTVNRLANIERSSFEVREDTLRRFAANKIASTLSDIRHFTARETPAAPHFGHGSGALVKRHSMTARSAQRCCPVAVRPRLFSWQKLERSGLEKVRLFTSGAWFLLV